MPNTKTQNPPAANEPVFFLVEWSKSRESKIAILHQAPAEGIETLESILKSTYNISEDPEITPITPTEETLAKASLGKMVSEQREDLVEIYPHPYQKDRILLEGQKGECFEVRKDKTFQKQKIEAKSPILEFWAADDAPLYDYDEDQYFHL